MGKYQSQKMNKTYNNIRLPIGNLYFSTYVLTVHQLNIFPTFETYVMFYPETI